MPRTLTSISALVLLVLAAAGPAHAADARPALSARLTACTTGSDPAARAATFTGSMPAWRGSRRMAMRFDLLQKRAGDKAFSPAVAPDWGVWVRSDAGRPGFIFTKRIESLEAPATYRAVVTFRWLDRKGHVIREAGRTTGRCVQPDPRPDLTLESFGAAATGKDTATYVVTVRNIGLSVADPSTVRVMVGGQVLEQAAVGPLAPDTSEQVVVRGARCAPGSDVLVSLDAGDVVDEVHELDDLVRKPCPLGA